MKTVPAAIATAVIGLVASLTLLETEEAMPPNATVYVDQQRAIYFSPPCLRLLDGAERAKFQYRPVEMTAWEARKRGVRPDDRCRNEGGFTGSSAMLLRTVLGTVGVPRPESRWERDGQWRW